MKSSAKSASLTAYEDLFKDDDTRQADSAERVLQIPVDELFAPVNHPYRVVNDEAMQEMAESVKTYGVLAPGIARPRPAGGYELLSGNRRKMASQLAGKSTMPVLVREMDDDAAIILMVDSNIQRENLLPSEKAKAYKMKLDALRRQAGRPSKENGAQVGHDYLGRKSVEVIADNSPDSRNQIQRFIRLNSLIPELLEMVDEKRIPLNPAVELSYLAEKEQAQVFDAITREETAPSLAQAKRLKKYSQEGGLVESTIDAIMTEQKPVEMKVVLRGDTLSRYFAKSSTPKQIEETIIKALDDWQRRQRMREQSR